MLIEKIETNLSKRKFHIKEEIKITEKSNTENNLIIIYPNITYQEIIGFGGAFTEASGYNLNKLNKEIANKIINDYFSIDGNNYNLCRTHINSCDFSLENYNYSNNPELKDFSIKRDKDFLIPTIKKAVSVNKSIKLLASPWSPPPFMKTNKKMNNGGKLLEKYYARWAEYLLKYIREYQKEGININYITIQNEPKATQSWESCLYSADQENKFINKYLFPLFQNAKINTKILLYDHNKEELYKRVNSIMKENLSQKSIYGAAFHNYSGDHFENIKISKEKFPNLFFIHTEGCNGYIRPYINCNKRNQIKAAERYAHDIIGDLNSGANGYIDWNLLLDYNGGPNHQKNFCSAPIMLNKRGNNYYKMLSFYYIGHFSKHIKRGAKRIAISNYNSEIESTAFINLDKTIVIIILNRNNKEIEYNLTLNDKIYNNIILRHSILTLIIKEEEHV
ncbi:MAG: glycoside hydrolase family 30 protein [Bacilli bacterium]|nr:glycoside hydrolase family 30 protein [Bacilli bacterium]